MRAELFTNVTAAAAAATGTKPKTIKSGKTKHIYHKETTKRYNANQHTSIMNDPVKRDKKICCNQSAQKGKTANNTRTNRENILFLINVWNFLFFWSTLIKRIW